MTESIAISWTFTGGGGASVTVVSCHVLGPIVMCVYIVPEEGKFGNPFFKFSVFDTLMHASKGILNLSTSSLNLCSPFEQNC